jgi:hypothetical protein
MARPRTGMAHPLSRLPSALPPFPLPPALWRQWPVGPVRFSGRKRGVKRSTIWARFLPCRSRCRVAPLVLDVADTPDFEDVVSGAAPIADVADAGPIVVRLNGALPGWVPHDHDVSDLVGPEV